MGSRSKRPRITYMHQPVARLSVESCQGSAYKYVLAISVIFRVNIRGLMWAEPEPRSLVGAREEV